MVVRNCFCAQAESGSGLAATSVMATVAPFRCNRDDFLRTRPVDLSALARSHVIWRQPPSTGSHVAASFKNPTAKTSSRHSFIFL